MIKVLFICHGNICRSTMAEYVMKHLVKQSGIESDFFIDSAGTSNEEHGNPVHRGTQKKLRKEESRVAITVHARCVEKNMPHSTTSSAWSDTIYRTL